MKISAPIRLRLKQVQHRIRSEALGLASLAILTYVLVYFLIEIILDHFFGLEQKTRLVFFTLFVVTTLGACFYGLAIPLLRSVNALYAAQFIEKQRPELDYSLLTYLESQNGEIPANLQNLLEKQTETVLSKIRTDSLFNWKILLSAGTGFIFIAFLFLGYSFLSPK